MSRPSAGTAIRDAGTLLDQIAERALDDDYYLVRTGPQRRIPVISRLATTLVLLACGLIVAVTAVQTHRDRPVSSLERDTLVADIEARQQQLRSREAYASELRAEVDTLQAAAGRTEPGRERLRLVTGDIAASGPGIVVTLTPGSEFITDADLRGLVNALWVAGAEAISVNGQRIGALSSIRIASGSMIVNFNPIGPPYALTVLGDESTLGERLRASDAGRYWEARQRSGAVVFTVDAESELRVPATPAARTSIQHAEVAEGAR